MAERISRARQFLPEEDECERRRFVPRRAKRRPREKKLLSGTNARRTYARENFRRARWWRFGREEGKEGGWGKQQEDEKEQRLGRSSRIILMMSTVILVSPVGKLA